MIYGLYGAFVNREDACCLFIRIYVLYADVFIFQNLRDTPRLILWVRDI